MNEGRSFRKSGAGALFATLALFAPMAAQADNFVGTDFGTLAMQAQKSAEFDYAGNGYHKLNLSVLGDTAWVPGASGAQGPMRSATTDPAIEAAAERSARLQHDTDMRVWPIGGPNTP